MNDIVFCQSGGCMAKLGAGALQKVLEKIPKEKDDKLLIGYDCNDDAAVYQLTEQLALVQTLDFFPPMIEDPYLFGQIAAANALSDIYAMGAQVKTALNIVCFPEKMDLNILGQILLGGSEKVKEASGILAGGHSIQDNSVKYGLSVTGIIDPKKIRTNNGGKVGDHLILTKPLGVGLICTAARVGEASKEVLEKAICSMTTLNRYAAEIANKYDIHACTDITGFGLLGHINEMLTYNMGALLYSSQIPYFKEAKLYAEEFLLTAAAQRNRNFLKDNIIFEEIDFGMQEILFDPQTSGGLLFSIAPEQSDDFLEEIKLLGLPCGKIGELTEQVKSILVKQ